MQKKTYETPDLIVYGTIETITAGSRYFSTEDSHGSNVGTDDGRD